MVCYFELEILWKMRIGFLLDQEAAMDVSLERKRGLWAINRTKAAVNHVI